MRVISFKYCMIISFSKIKRLIKFFSKIFQKLINRRNLETHCKLLIIFVSLPYI